MGRNRISSAPADAKRRFWTVERYFIRQLSTYWLLAVLSIVLIFLITQFVRVGPVFAGSNASPSECLWALALVTVPVVGWALTPAFCVAIFAATGRMTADGELVALHSAGVGPMRLCIGPLMLIGVLMMGSASIWLSLAPRAQTAFRSLAVDLAGRAIVGRLKPKHFSTPIDGVTFFADEKKESGVFHGVMIEDTRNPVQTRHLVVESAKLATHLKTMSIVVSLGQGTGFLSSQDSTTGQIAMTFESMDFRFPIGENLDRSLDFLPLSLTVPTTTLGKPPPDGQNPRRWRYAFWTRVAAPLGLLVVTVLSTFLALGLAIARKGLAVTVAALLFMTYHLLVRFFESLLEKGILDPFAAALGPILLVALTGPIFFLPLRKLSL